MEAPLLWTRCDMGWYTGPIIGGSVPCPGPSSRVVQGQGAFGWVPFPSASRWDLRSRDVTGG